MTQPATRMQTIPPYFFAELGKRIARLRADGHDVIRMDMGSPDMPPAPHIIEALVNSARDPSNHGYSPFGGTPSFLKAVTDHYQRRFDVQLDVETEVVGLIGSKEGLFNIVQSHVNPGDVVLVPDPGYPVYTTSARFAGGEVVHLPLTEDHDFLPDLDSIEASALKRAKLMWLNYPNNPTGAVADLEYFEEAIEFAREHDILLCHDAPYTEVCFDDYLAPSLMQVEGAKEVAVEFNSLSKSHNMAGWRVGMAVGNADAIRALYTLKSQVDTSQFRSIFDAGVTALEGDQSWLAERNAIYQLRRDMILEAIGEAGLSADRPQAALYVWASLPEGATSSMDYCSRMLQEIYVSITPGVAFGDAGEGYVRLSLSSPTEKVEQAMARVAEWKY